MAPTDTSAHGIGSLIINFNELYRRKFGDVLIDDSTGDINNSYVNVDTTSGPLYGYFNVGEYYAHDENKKSYSTVSGGAYLGLEIANGGSTMYVTDGQNAEIHQFTLDTAWTYSSISHVRTWSYGQDSTPSDIVFKPDGTRCYIAGYNSNTIYQHDLSTAWDISTASLNGSEDMSSITTNVTATDMSPEGNHLIAAGETDDFAYSKNDLNTPWDITGSQSWGNSGDLGAIGTDVGAIRYHPDGHKYFVMFTGSGDLHSVHTNGFYGAGLVGSNDSLSIGGYDESFIFEPTTTRIMAIGGTGYAELWIK